nr:uncharacterized protein CTRU02_09305 [Colletotrichum truncatum]KAF6788983.1 hypothetical protein CTRU02_09305 [Colletotrichum truncatum]
MPGRTVSNSSDVSATSLGSRSDDYGDLVMSGLNTPAQEKTGIDGFRVPAAPEVRSPRGKLRVFVELMFPSNLPHITAPLIFQCHGFNSIIDIFF